MAKLSGDAWDPQTREQIDLALKNNQDLNDLEISLTEVCSDKERLHCEQRIKLTNGNGNGEIEIEGNFGKSEIISAANETLDELTDSPQPNLVASEVSMYGFDDNPALKSVIEENLESLGSEGVAQVVLTKQMVEGGAYIASINLVDSNGNIGATYATTGSSMIEAEQKLKENFGITEI